MLHQILAQYSNNFVYTSQSMNLKDFQSRGIFTNPPDEAKNLLTANEFLNCTLIVYAGEKCLIKKKDKIIACDPQLQILPKMDNFYINGNNRFSDDPCNERTLLTAELHDIQAILTILPYLQAIPLYQP